MQHRTALALALSLLAAGQAAQSSPRPTPAPSLAPPARMDILVDGAVRPRYLASGTWYIEALKGKEYAIRLTNPYPVRVAVALAVDGLNTIDAQHTTAADARKWVIEPYGTIVISGWQTSLTHARRFQFTTEDRSYGAWLGKTNDLGVISAVFFRERMPEVLPMAELSNAPAAEGGLRNDAGRDRASQSAAKAGMAGAPPAAPQPAAKGDYAATGIGRKTGHAVRQIHMDLEDTPASSISIRYQYRPQLVRLGILPPVPADDGALARREKARGFVKGFCPDPKREW